VGVIPIRPSEVALTDHDGELAPLIAVALVEPQALIREALKALLNTGPAIAVVAEAETVAQILPIIQGAAVDLLLLSLEPGVDDPDAALGLLATAGLLPCHVLVLTSASDPELHLHLLELGAMGVVLKDQTGEVLKKAIRTVHGGELWLDRASVGAVISRLKQGRGNDFDVEALKVQSLTAREREVVALVADGLANTRIAERLFISAATVRNHLTSILDKLGLTDRYQLTVYVFRRGLVLNPPTAEMLRMSATMNELLVRPPGRHSTKERKHR
jgi:DNA-binding NarL/FixJ family response regulator